MGNDDSSGERRYESDDDDWQPTPHGALLAHALTTHDLVRDADVLELGGGVGNHTTVLLQRGARSVVTTEITEGRSETTRRNVEQHCPDAADVSYQVADWLSLEGTFDVVLTNPPFAVSGKQNRRYFIDSLILDAHKRLRPGGRLIFVQSSMADIEATRRRLVENGYSVRIVETSRGPFRDYYFEDPTFMEEIALVPNGFEIVDGQHIETLYVVEAELQPFTPPGTAHLP